MISSTQRRPFRMLGGVATILTLLLLAACGGENEGEDSGSGQTDITPGTASSSTLSDQESLPADREFSIGEEFWHSGFHVQLADGLITATEDELTGEIDHFVSISATFENLGGSETFFDGAVAVVTEGNSYPSTLASEIPTVPSGLSTSGGFSFVVNPGFDPAAATLVIGAGEVSKAIIPLGEGDVVDLAPIQFDLSGSLSMELIDLVFESASIRADVPDMYHQLEEGKRALTLHFDAVSRRSGNWSVFADNFALIGLDGTGIAPDGASLDSLPGSDAGITTEGLSVRFLVDAPGQSEYTLRFTPGDWFVGEDGVTEATYEFGLG